MLKRPTFKDWWEEIALPLYTALDDISANMPITEGEKPSANSFRWYYLIGKVPWLAAMDETAQEAAKPPEESGWVNVNSSNIKRYRMESDDGEGLIDCLIIEFMSGATWKYRGIPGATLGAFSTAESHGKFFAAEIKGRYPGERLDDGASTESAEPAE